MLRAVLNVELVVIGREPTPDLAEQFHARLIPGGSRRHHRGPLALEQEAFQRELLVTTIVDLEPLRVLQRAQAHREAPTARVDRYVDAVHRHRYERRRRTARNQKPASTVNGITMTTTRASGKTAPLWTSATVVVVSVAKTEYTSPPPPTSNLARYYDSRRRREAIDRSGKVNHADLPARP